MPPGLWFKSSFHLQQLKNYLMTDRRAMSVMLVVAVRGMF